MQIGLQVGGLKNFSKFQWHGFGHSSAKKGHHVFKLEYYTENTGMETLSPYYSHPLIDSVATCFLIFDFFLFYLHCCLLGALDSQHSPSTLPLIVFTSLLFVGFFGEGREGKGVVLLHPAI